MAGTVGTAGLALASHAGQLSVILRIGEQDQQTLYKGKKYEYLTGATRSSIMLALLRILAECLVMNNCASRAHHQTGPVVPALHIMLCGGKHATMWIYLIRCCSKL